MRAFLAIPLPEQLQEEIFQYQQRVKSELAGRQIAWNRNLHITIHFLGELARMAEMEVVGEEYLDTILPVVLSITAKIEPFSLVLSGVGSFPPKQKSMVGSVPFWIGVDGGEPLQRLHHEIVTAIVPPGPRGLSDRKRSSRGRGFHPHLTLGRLKGRASQVRFEELSPFVKTEVAVDRLCLYQSILKPNGAEHQLHQEFFFRG